MKVEGLAFSWYVFLVGEVFIADSFWLPLSFMISLLSKTHANIVRKTRLLTKLAVFDGSLYSGYMDRLRAADLWQIMRRQLDH